MSEQRLFNVPKVGVFLDGYHPAFEKRKGQGEVKVIICTFRVAPFDAKLARAIDDGVGGDTNLRALLFKLNHPDPKPHLDRVNFSIDCARQNMKIYAAPDTLESRIALLQVRIGGVYARTQKDRNGFDLVFTGSFGPVGRDELEYVHDWHRTQRFISFEESEPLIEVEDEQPSDADEKARVHVGQTPPKPMWDESDQRTAASEDDEVLKNELPDKKKKEPANRKLITGRKFGKGRKGRK